MNRITRRRIKYAVTFVGVALLYFSNNIFFKSDNNYYQSLDTIHVPPIVFAIVWTIIYILMSILITYYLFARPQINKRFWIYVGINFIAQYLFVPLFFYAHNLLLALIVTAISFVTIILVTVETYNYNRKTALLPLPYVLWAGFATFLSLVTYLSN